MNATLAPRELVVRIELTCFYCGHGCGEVRVPTNGRPTYGDIRTAVEGANLAPAPEWDAHGEPRCPRCGGKLFMEESDRRLYPARA